MLIQRKRILLISLRALKSFCAYKPSKLLSLVQKNRLGKLIKEVFRIQRRKKLFFEKNTSLVEAKSSGLNRAGDFVWRSAPNKETAHARKRSTSIMLLSAWKVHSNQTTGQSSMRRIRIVSGNYTRQKITPFLCGLIDSLLSEKTSAGSTMRWSTPARWNTSTTKSITTQLKQKVW